MPSVLSIFRVLSVRHLMPLLCAPLWVTSWLCDKTCMWRVDRWRDNRVTSWLVALTLLFVFLSFPSSLSFHFPISFFPLSLPSCRSRPLIVAISSHSKHILVHFWHKFAPFWPSKWKIISYVYSPIKDCFRDLIYKYRLLCSTIIQVSSKQTRVITFWSYTFNEGLGLGVRPLEIFF